MVHLNKLRVHHAFVARFFFRNTIAICNIKKYRNNNYERIECEPNRIANGLSLWYGTEAKTTPRKKENATTEL